MAGHAEDRLPEGGGILMNVRNIEQYDVEAWAEDLSGLYYG